MSTFDNSTPSVIIDASSTSTTNAHSYLISAIVHKTKRSPISPLSFSRHHPRPVARTQTQMPPTRTSCSRSSRRKSRMTTGRSESRASKSCNASTEEPFYFLCRFRSWLTGYAVLLACRMERLKHMREEMHGKYTELTDEKEVIRTSA